MSGDGIQVRFPVAPAAAYAYLVDARNRPAWQSSLRAVADVVLRDGGPLADTWTDITVVPGVRPRMRTTYADAERWVEEGEWGPFRARLELHFAPADDGCLVTARFRVGGLGAGPAVTAASVPAIRADLLRAARNLGS